MLHFRIDCPACHTRINIPFVRKLERKAIEEFDLAEVTAQDNLLCLELWLHGASLITLLKYWLRRK